MKKLLVIAILLSACSGGNKSKPAATDTAAAPVIKAPENPITGTPKKLGEIEIAEKDFTEPMVWDQAKAACEGLGNGWRLPSKEELSEIYGKKDSIGGFESDVYWTSSDADTFNAAVVNFSDGTGGRFSKIYNGRTRAVRNY